MGQYYKAVILDESGEKIKKWFRSHDYASGLKLMEHSWKKNTFVKSVESFIKHKPERVVWAGDYQVIQDDEESFYDMCEDRNKQNSDSGHILYNEVETRFVINHSKKEYVDKYKCPNKNGWVVHPLPLLTCISNGHGGGDYFSDNGKDYVGSWAKDLISVASKKPKGYKEIFPNFQE